MKGSPMGGEDKYMTYCTQHLDNTLCQFRQHACTEFIEVLNWITFLASLPFPFYFVNPNPFSHLWPLCPEPVRHLVRRSFNEVGSLGEGGWQENYKTKPILTFS